MVGGGRIDISVRNINHFSPALTLSPLLTWDQTLNLDTCPDQELNLQPFFCGTTLQLSHTSQCLLGNLKVHVDHPANILAFYPRLLSFPTSTSPPQHTFTVPSSDLGMTCMYSAPPLKLSNSPSVRVHALFLSLSEVKFT